jgi:hypothetical protein
MPFKKKEVLVNPKEQEQKKVLEIREFMKKVTEDSYSELSIKYDMPIKDIEKIHKRVIYKYLV